MKTIKQDNPDFHLPEGFQTPNSLIFQKRSELIFQKRSELIKVICRALNRRYADFYLDRRPKEGDDAEEAIEEVLLAFGKPCDILSHRRYVAMGCAMALAARSTFAYHEIDDDRIDMVLNHTRYWLEAGSEERANIAPQPANVVFFDADTVRGNDSIDDAYYLHFHLLNALQKESAYESTVELLYVSLLGDAISALPERRRELFNWWLTDVLPYAYHLQLPQAFYSGSWPFSAIVQPNSISEFYSSYKSRQPSQSPFMINQKELINA